MAVPNRLENLRTLRVANADVAFATAFATLVTGTFLVGFIKMLGGGDFWINLVGALPSLLGILQIPGAIWGRRYAGYKKFVSFGGGTWRAMYIPVAILPLIALDPNLTLGILLLCVTVAAACTLVVSPIYNDWIAEMVPESSRGWYFSRRNSIATAVGATIGVLGALALDFFRRQGNERTGFAVVFGAGVVCAAISMALFLRMKDIPRPDPIRDDFMGGIRAIGRPFADRQFRRVLVFLGMLFLGQSFAGNLYGAYALESLKLSFTTIQLTGVMQAIGMVAAAPMWGFLADRYGNRPSLFIAGLGIATNPVAWLLTVPGNTQANVAILLSGHVLMGVFWSGVALCQFNLLLATANERDRANYLAAGLALQSVVAGIGPILGATMMAELRLHNEPIVAYKSVFITALVLRVLAVLFLKPVREVGSTSLRTTLAHLRKVTPKGLMAMRSLTHSEGTADRAEAIEQVASQGYALAAEELVRALNDPSARVRREAASALIKIGDASAAKALLEQLQEHPDLIEEETIDALGHLGGDSAVDTLISFLEHPRPLVRRAAARALGSLGSPRAIESLTQVAGRTDDPDLRRASIQGLRMLEASESGTVIADALFDPHPSVRIAAAEAVAELEFRDARPYLRQALAYYDDEAQSEIAYALGVVGDGEDGAIILDVAAKSASSTSRRRCLLGYARLLGVESQAYKLMLRQGMDRDQALMTLLAPVGKRSPRIKSALSKFSSGDERGAIAALASTRKDPAIQELLRAEVAESFLVAAPYIAANWA